MKLVKITEPFADHVQIRRDAENRIETNIPHSVVSHSPTGFEFGYAGSGPADLALNILNAFVPPTGRRRVKCFKGFASPFALRHHQAFKFDFLVNVPHEGVTIWRKDILAWIDSKRRAASELPQDAGTLHAEGT